MQKLSSFIIFILILSSCAGVQTNRDIPRKQVTNVNMKSQKDPTIRKRIMVLPFLDAREDRDPKIRENARKAFVMDLNRTGQVIAIDSQELKTDLSKEVKNGEYIMREIAKEAGQLGVNSVLEGKIMELKVRRSSDQVGLIRQMTTQYETVVRVRVVSTRGQRELMNIVKTVTLDDPHTRVGERVEKDRLAQDNAELIQIIIKDAFMDFTPQVLASLEQIVWEGRIAAINGDRIYLNVGKVSGLQMGDILKVTEEGDDIYDPDSGSHIGKVPGRMKGTVEVVSYFGTDGAIAIIHSGAGFKENDKVELY